MAVLSFGDESDTVFLRNAILRMIVSRARKHVSSLKSVKWAAEKVSRMDRYRNLANPLPTGVDPDLEFMSTHCGGWHFLVGNPHTFPGRMAAWCQDQQAEIAVSLSAMTYVSLGATFWIRGFLSGSEPAPPESDKPAVEAEWEAARREYRSSGKWPGDHDSS